MSIIPLHVRCRTLSLRDPLFPLLLSGRAALLSITVSRYVSTAARYRHHCQYIYPELQYTIINFVSKKLSECTQDLFGSIGKLMTQVTWNRYFTANCTLCARMPKCPTHWWRMTECKVFVTISCQDKLELNTELYNPIFTLAIGGEDEDSDGVITPW